MKKAPGSTAPADAAPDPRDVAVDAWFAKHFHNMGAQLDTPVVNLLRSAAEDLKAILRALPLAP